MSPAVESIISQIDLLSEGEQYLIWDHLHSVDWLAAPRGPSNEEVSRRRKEMIDGTDPGTPGDVHLARLQEKFGW